MYEDAGSPLGGSELVEPIKGTAKIDPKRQFLTKLSSAGKLDYKRYTASPLRYAGGKSLAVGYVIENLPDGVERIASPFFGGGSVEIACSKELGLEVIGYDIFDILANYWKMQIKRPAALADRIAEWPADQEHYKVVKKRLKGHWTGEEPISDSLSLAAHYWFNHNLSYGPGFLGWRSKIYEDSRRVDRLLEKVRCFQPGNLKVKKGNFRNVLPRHSKDFLYCDPPYYLEGDSKMFRGIYPQRNFPVHHNGFDHALLRDLLRKHKGGFILSYNDCKTIRDWYSDFRIIEVAWQYTLGQGETRIGKNRLENGTSNHVKKSHEILILGKAHG